MGQAKMRGKLSERISLAQNRTNSLKPKSIICNNCNNEIHDVFPMDSRGMKGIDAAFGAQCPVCSQVSWALKGNPAAIADLSLKLEEHSGGIAQFGTQLVET